MTTEKEWHPMSTTSERATQNPEESPLSALVINTGCRPSRTMFRRSLVHVAHILVSVFHQGALNETDEEMLQVEASMATAGCLVPTTMKLTACHTDKPDPALEVVSYATLK